MGLLLKRQRIAIVPLYGTIGGSIRTPTYERVFSRVLKDRHIRALVLDIDSPGGSVPASDYLYHSVARIADNKPVVAGIRGFGVSGAYLVSCAAQRIVAIPGAIVGSIGVISIRPVLEQLLGRIGVGINVSKSGAYKDMGAFWRGPTTEEETKLQSLIDESYEVFISAVVRSRKLDESQVRAIATGEVFWATKARELGLIDELGDLDTAIDLAAKISGAPRRPLLLGPRRTFRERIFGPFAESLVEATADEIDRRLWATSFRY